VSFGLGDALRLGYDSIKKRRDRALINISSIALGIAFLSTLLLTDSFYRAFVAAGEAYLSIESYNYWLMFVALIVSVVGITNAVLIAVYERYREIGTLKCIGAMDSHILLLFLVESIIQGGIGGILGFILGIVGALISTGTTTGFDIILKVPVMEIVVLFLGSTLLSIFLSVIATIYPARHAAKLNPVKALSYEL
jgi:ABC-type lipoprotein release transport system permease subunit